MKKNKKILISIMCIFSICLSGCWDKVEIDDRVFIISMGIDAGEDIKKAEKLKSPDFEFPILKDEIKKLKVTYSFPDLKNMKVGSAETKSISIDSYSLPDAANKFSNKSSKDLYLGHTKILFIGSEIFQYKDVVKEIIDYIQRYPALNSNIIVVVCDGKAEDYIKFKTPIENNIENYVGGIINNSEKNGCIPKVTLDKFISAMEEEGNILVPEIKMDKNKQEVMLNQMAIIKEYSMVGDLSQEDMCDVQILKGKAKGGKKSIIYKNHTMDYVINGTKTNVKLSRENGKLIYHIDIDLEGRLDGDGSKVNLLSVKELSEVERAFDKVIKGELERFMKVSKERYDTDFIGLKEYTKRFHPNVWKEVGGDWKKQFADSIILINVRTDIRRVGTTN